MFCCSGKKERPCCNNGAELKIKTWYPSSSKAGDVVLLAMTLQWIWKPYCCFGMFDTWRPAFPGIIRMGTLNVKKKKKIFQNGNMKLCIVYRICNTALFLFHSKLGDFKTFIHVLLFWISRKIRKDKPIFS